MATHSSILFFFFAPKSIFIHSKGPHHSNIHQFPEDFSLIVHFPSYVLQKEKQKAKHTSLVRCAELGWEETGSVKEVGRERPYIMTQKYTEC